MTNTVTICIEPKLLRQIDEFAKIKKMSRSHVIRYMILKQLKQKRKEE